MIAAASNYTLLRQYEAAACYVYTYAADMTNVAGDRHKNMVVMGDLFYKVPFVAQAIESQYSQVLKFGTANLQLQGEIRACGSPQHGVSEATPR